MCRRACQTQKYSPTAKIGGDGPKEGDEQPGLGSVDVERTTVTAGRRDDTDGERERDESGDYGRDCQSSPRGEDGRKRRRGRRVEQPRKRPDDEFVLLGERDERNPHRERAPRRSRQGASDPAGRVFALRQHDEGIDVPLSPMSPRQKNEEPDGCGGVEKPDGGVSPTDEEIQHADGGQPPTGDRLAAGPGDREVVDSTVWEAEDDDTDGERNQLVGLRERETGGEAERRRGHDGPTGHEGEPKQHRRRFGRPAGGDSPPVR